MNRSDNSRCSKIYEERRNLPKKAEKIRPVRPRLSIVTQVTCWIVTIFGWFFLPLAKVTFIFKFTFLDFFCWLIRLEIAKKEICNCGFLLTGFFVFFFFGGGGESIYSDDFSGFLFPLCLSFFTASFIAYLIVFKP